MATWSPLPLPPGSAPAPRPSSSDPWGSSRREPTLWAGFGLFVVGIVLWAVGDVLLALPFLAVSFLLLLVARWRIRRRTREGLEALLRSAPTMRSPTAPTIPGASSAPLPSERSAGLSTEPLVPSTQANEVRARVVRFYEITGVVVASLLFGLMVVLFEGAFGLSPAVAAAALTTAVLLPVLLWPRAHRLLAAAPESITFESEGLSGRFRGSVHELVLPYASLVQVRSGRETSVKLGVLLSNPVLAAAVLREPPFPAEHPGGQFRALVLVTPEVAAQVEAARSAWQRRILSAAALAGAAESRGLAAAPPVVYRGGDGTAVIPSAEDASGRRSTQGRAPPGG